MRFAFASSVSVRRLRAAFLCLPVIAVACLAQMQQAQAQVVISQVYGGGGNSGARYTHDFVELFNAGATQVPITGWSVQYAATTGSNWSRTSLTGTLQAGQYYLVQMSKGAGNDTPLPPFDASNPNVAMAGGAGKVALMTVDTTIPAGTSCPSANVADFVGYGAGTNCFEGSGPTGTLSNTNSALRNQNGCQDTNQNGSDFTVVTVFNPGVTPGPRNTQSTLNPCVSPTPMIISASPLTGATIGVPYSFTFAASGGKAPYTWSVTAGAVPSGMNFGNDGVLSGTSFTEATALFTVQVMDANNVTATKDFSLTVNQPSCNTSTTIAGIQGNGNLSPIALNTLVTTSGLVTGVKSNGYFIQMPGNGDGDPSTSDGVFVFTNDAPPAAAARGSLVCVSGRVAEFRPGADPASPTMTELTSPGTTLMAVNQPLPAPVLLSAANTNPNGDVYQLEKYEGMRVMVDSLTVAAPTTGNLDEPNASAVSNGFFHGVITGIARPMREPGVQQPANLPPGSPCCVTQWDANPELLNINSGNGRPPLDVTVGATVSNLVGPVDYSRRLYTIVVDPDAAPGVAGLAAATPAPAQAAGELTVAHINLERFYDTADADGKSDVVLTEAAFNHRLSKASLAIRHTLKTPDVLGLVEVENIGVALALAAKINADAVAAGEENPDYQAYMAPSNDIGNIAVGALVKSQVQVLESFPIGVETTYLPPGSSTPAILNDRPSLVMRLSARRSPLDPALPFTLIVNHLRSLTGIDQSDGARIRAKRGAQAEFLASYVQSRQAANPAERIALVGDFNAFQFSDGYVDMMGTIAGAPAPANTVVLANADLVNPDLTNLTDSVNDPAQRYSFLFGGNAQVLDHILVNQALLPSFSRIAYARNNADFPDIYRNDANRPERVSDHDAPVAYFNLPVNQPPVAADQTASAGYNNGPSTFALNASDPEGATLAYELTGNPSKGTVTIDAAGNATYTPNQNTSGADSFTYSVTDDAGQTASATVTVNIVAVNISGRVSLATVVVSYNQKQNFGHSNLRVTNTSGETIYAPLQLLLTGLTPGVTVQNAGMTAAGPYVTEPKRQLLAPGATIMIHVEFTGAPGIADVSFVPELWNGNF